MGRESDGDPITSEDRNLLRLVANGHAATSQDIARLLGVSRREAGGKVRVLTAAGYLGVRRLEAGQHHYEVTVAGTAELAANVTSYLLVQVDDRVAADTAYLLERQDGITSVTVHSPGCCCKNCPWGGDHG
jgi:hypothetical protein